VTWEVVARKDFRDAVRSRWLQGLAGFFLVFLAGGTLAFYEVLFGGNSEATSDILFGTFVSGLLSFSFPGLFGLLLAFIALLTSYDALIGERETGTLKLLLSLPHSRRDLVAGKLAGRSVVVVAPVLVGFLLAVLAMIVVGVRVNFGTFLPQVALTALMGVAFVSIGIGISAGAGTGRRAILATFGLYFVFGLLWTLVAQGVPTVVTEVQKALGMETLATAAATKLRLFVTFLNPLRAYETLVAQVYYAADASQGASPVVRARLIKEGIFTSRRSAQALGDSVPAYLSGEFILVVLLAWIVVPPVVGYLGFRDADL
jgi:ABC-2 type transport system permease protein